MQLYLQIWWDSPSIRKGLGSLLIGRDRSSRSAVRIFGRWAVSCSLWPKRYMSKRQRSTMQSQFVRFAICFAPSIDSLQVSIGLPPCRKARWQNLPVVLHQPRQTGTPLFQRCSQCLAVVTRSMQSVCMEMPASSVWRASMFWSVPSADLRSRTGRRWAHWIVIKKRFATTGCHAAAWTCTLRALQSWSTGHGLIARAAVSHWLQPAKWTDMTWQWKCYLRLNEVKKERGVHSSTVALVHLTTCILLAILCLVCHSSTVFSFFGVLDISRGGPYSTELTPWWFCWYRVMMVRYIGHLVDNKQEEFPLLANTAITPILLSTSLT